MSLTIKQAFEALSDACANGMKNPFFVMRRLKESFADVASKVVVDAGSVNYSTTEHVVGKWIDNSTIYEKTINLGTMPNNTSSIVNIDISNIGIIIDINCIGIASTGAIPVPYVDDAYKNGDVLFDINTSTGTARMVTASDKSVYTAYLTIRYTKSST